MIDHLMSFATEADAIAALPRFRVGEGKDAAWDTSQCIPDSRVYAVTGTVEDRDGNVSETRDYVPGWFIQVGLVAQDAILDKMAAATVTDRESKTRIKVDTAVAAKAGWRVEPVFAGS